MEPSVEAHSKSDRSKVRRPWLRGAVLGALISAALGKLGFAAMPGMFWLGWLPLVALLGAAFGIIGRVRFVEFIALLAVCAMLIVGYTPLVPRLMPSLEREEVAGDADAVVVLGAMVMSHDALSGGAKSRIVRGYELLAGHPELPLVLTRTPLEMRPWVTIVREQMRTLKLTNEVIEVGEVRTTRDEAVLVAELVKQKGWSSVYLVTHPWHMRRAAAVFEKAGVSVLCRPCQEEGFDMYEMPYGGDRYEAFQRWLHEEVGFWTYRKRGWI
jgi:uncharacterized SAM-binding protein YcdF (DUF218 family)